MTSAWLTFALFTGYAYTGQWQSWALVNKYAGWHVLLGYLILGQWATNTGPDGTKTFLRWFVVTSWIICLLTYLAILFSGVARVPLYYLVGADFRPVGLLVNPNAFGFLISLAIVCHLAMFRRGNEFSHRLGAAGLAVGLAVLALTGSRSAWFGMALGLAGLAVARQMPWRLLAAAAIAAALLVSSALILIDVIKEFFAGPASEFVAWIIFGSSDAAEGRQLIDPGRESFVYLMTKDLFSVQHHTVFRRWDQALRAWELWLQHPVSGVGLGSYLWSEARLGITLPQQIHSTGLWLLAETGLPGAILVTGFLAVSLWSLRPWAAVNRGDPLAVFGFSMLLAFAGFSLGQEAIYQRHFWFLLGIVLALGSAPRNRRGTLDQAARRRGQ